MQQRGQSLIDPYSVAQTKFNTLGLPVFAFSYQVQGEYYSGRFALVPHTVEYDESLIDQMIGRKLVVCCDPAHPDRWLIPDEMIDGYKVEQKRDPHRILRYVGLCLFLVSFFLPALGDMRGFLAAFFGIIFVRPWEPDDKISALAAFGVWLNPEVLLLFFLSIFQRCPRLRALLVATILFSIPMTWIALNRMDHAGVAVYPLGPGHFLWIAGILLIVFAESSAFRFSPARWLIVGLGIVTAAMSVPILIGFTMRAPREADDFHYDQAWDTQNPAECRLIDANAVGRLDQRDSSDFTYMQSDCYRNVAAMRHDPQLCDHVKSGSLDRLIGSVVAKSKCRKQKYTIGSAFPGTRSSPDPFSR